MKNNGTQKQIGRWGGWWRGLARERERERERENKREKKTGKTEKTESCKKQTMVEEIL